MKGKASAVFGISAAPGHRIDLDPARALLEKERRGRFVSDRRKVEGGTLVVGGLAHSASEMIMHGCIDAELNGAGGVETALDNGVSGEFAFASLQEGCVLAARDPLGAKPLYMGTAAGLAVVSTEPSVIRGYSMQPSPAGPGDVIKMERGGLVSKRYCGDLVGEPFEGDLERSSRAVGELLKASLRTRIGEAGAVGVAFSGGLDSSLLALFASAKHRVLLVSVFAGGSKDSSSVSKAADEMGLELLKVRVGMIEVEGASHAALDSGTSWSRMDKALSAGFYLASSGAREQGMELLLAGQGADEIFGGYHRHLRLASHEPGRLNSQLVDELPRLEVGLRRDERAIARGGCEASFPYADFPLARFALSLPSDHLISGGIRKVVLRRLAEKSGLPASIVNAEKKAFQYSSGIQALL
ncbi:MAG: asparagine synthase-related protein [Conexivisphaerales archaeon]